MCRSKQDPGRGTATVHAAGWDPTSIGRGWTSKYNIIDGHSSRISYSDQRHRDGRIRSDRPFNMLSKGTQPGVLGPHPQILRDGSPRNHIHKEHVLQWGHAADYATTHNMYYSNPHSHVGVQRSPRATRHEGAMPHRITPGIYATVFMRQPGEPPGSPRAMPAYSKLQTRGAASVPTAGHWAEPPNSTLPGIPTSPRVASAAVRQADDAYELMLLQAQIRSEKRIADAAMATAISIKAQKEAQRERWEQMAASGSLSARF